MQHQKYIHNDGHDCYLVKPIKYPIIRYEVLKYRRYNCVSEILHDVSKTVSEHYPMKGCVVGTFVLSYLVKNDFLIPHRGLASDGEYHWWLVDKLSNKVIDVTANQYSDNELSRLYSIGRKKELYSFGSRPQKRCMNMIQLIQPTSTFIKTDNLDSIEVSMNHTNFK